jgi:hypothetical protein
MPPQCRPNTARVDHIHTRQEKGYTIGMENIVDTIYSLKKKKKVTENIIRKMKDEIDGGNTDF